MHVPHRAGRPAAGQLSDQRPDPHRRQVLERQVPERRLEVVAVPAEVARAGGRRTVREANQVCAQSRNGSAPPRGSTHSPRARSASPRPAISCVGLLREHPGVPAPGVVAVHRPVPAARGLLHPAHRTPATHLQASSRHPEWTPPARWSPRVGEVQPGPARPAEGACRGDRCSPAPHPPHDLALEHPAGWVRKPKGAADLVLCEGE